MKKIISWSFILISAVVLLGGMQVYAADMELTSDPFSSFQGDGTQYNPYLISSYEDLSSFRDIVDSGNPCTDLYFEQEKDIVIPDGVNWNPIGDVSSGIAFDGTYKGNGHVVSNIHCEDQYAGFFSFLSGSVENFGIESGLFSGATIGSITSHGTGTGQIINCYNKADVVASDRGGGITDNYAGLVLYCWSLGSVSSASDSALLAGISSYGSASIEGCFSAAGHDLVSSNTFSGTVSESSVISFDQIGESLEHLYGLMQKDSVTDHRISRNKTVFPIFLDGSVHFDPSYLPPVFVENDYDNLSAFVDALQNRYSFSGNGSKEDPFLISSYEDLCRLRDCVDEGVSYKNYYFHQTADIEFPDENWDPIGDLKNQLMFDGTYDGGGHVLINVNCDDQYAGVFSYLGGEVRNLGIESGHFTGDTIGSITSHGAAGAAIINCYNKASVTGQNRAGGITDNYPGLIAFCWNTGDISGIEETASVAGITSYGSADIEHSYSTGDGPIVVPDIFSGTVYESGTVDNDEIQETLEKSYSAASGYEDEDGSPLITGNNTVFLKYDSGNIGFSPDYVPEAVRADAKSGIIVEAVLAVLCVALAVFALFFFRERSRGFGAETVREQAGSHISSKKTDNEELPDGRASHRKSFRSHVVSVILTCSIFVVCFSVAAGILNNEYTAGVLNLKFFRKDENRNTDVLLLGGSSMSVNVEIAELWQKYGIAAYCLGAGGSTIYDSYYRLVDAEQKHHIGKAVLEVRGTTYSSEYSGTEGKQENITGVSLSANKIRYVNAAVPADERLDYLLTFPLYHSRYNSVNEWDFLHRSSLGRDDKGTWTVFYGNPFKPELVDASDITAYKIPDEKEERYLYKTIEYCRENDIELILLKSPDGNREIDQPFFNAVKVIAEQANIPYLDMNQHDEEIQLLPEDFYYDNFHLNVAGARKCTDFLGEWLSENFEFTDHRGDPEYDSWERFSSNREDLYLSAITDPEDYFAELERDGKKVTAIPYRMDQKDIEADEALKEGLRRFPYETVEPLYARSEDNDPQVLSFGTNTLQVDADYEECKLTLNDNLEDTVSSPGLILVVYDETTGKIGDIVQITEGGNGLALAHLAVERE